MGKELCATAQHCYFHAFNVDLDDFDLLFEYEAIKRNNIDISAPNLHGLSAKIIRPQLLEAPISPYFAQRTWLDPNPVGSAIGVGAETHRLAKFRVGFESYDRTATDHSHVQRVIADIGADVKEKITWLHAARHIPEHSQLIRSLIGPDLALEVVRIRVRKTDLIRRSLRFQLKEDVCGNCLGVHIGINGKQRLVALMGEADYDRT